MIQNIQEAWKTVVALVSAALTWGTLVVDSPSQSITSQEWLALGFALIGVVGVWTVPNKSAPDATLPPEEPV